MAGFFRGYGGYVDFKGFEYYRDNFNLTNPWIGLAASASSVSILFLLIALWWWLECRLLWADRHQRTGALRTDEGRAIELQVLRTVAS